MAWYTGEYIFIISTNPQRVEMMNILLPLRGREIQNLFSF